jgi:hypothetical protein
MHRYCNGSCLPSLRFIVSDEAMLRTVNARLRVRIYVIANDDSLQRRAGFLDEHVMKDRAAVVLQVLHDVHPTALRCWILVLRHSDMEKAQAFHLRQWRHPGAKGYRRTVPLSGMEIACVYMKPEKLYVGAYLT